MPYVITTSTPRGAAEVPPHMRAIPNALGPRVSRCAVATLDEAQSRAFSAIDRAAGKLTREMNSDEQREDRAYRMAVRFDIEQGGTVGPLPDGTVIEVAPVAAYDLLLRIPGMDVPKRPDEVRPLTERPHNVAEIVAAFNAAQGAEVTR